MTYKVKPRERKCEFCGEQIPPSQINHIGTPRKYCIKCTLSARRAKDLEKKHHSRTIEKAQRLLKNAKEHPEILDQVNNMLSEYQERKEKTQKEVDKIVRRLMNPASPRRYVDGIYLEDFEIKPRNWTEKEIVSLIQREIQKAKESKKLE